MEVPVFPAEILRLASHLEDAGDIGDLVASGYVRRLMFSGLLRNNENKELIESFVKSERMAIVVYEQNKPAMSAYKQYLNNAKSFSFPDELSHHEWLEVKSRIEKVMTIWEICLITFPMSERFAFRNDRRMLAKELIHAIIRKGLRLAMNPPGITESASFWQLSSEGEEGFKRQVQAGIDIEELKKYVESGALSDKCFDALRLWLDHAPSYIHNLIGTEKNKDVRKTPRALANEIQPLYMAGDPRPPTYKLGEKPQPGSDTTTDPQAIQSQQPTPGKTPTDTPLLDNPDFEALHPGNTKPKRQTRERLRVLYKCHDKSLSIEEILNECKHESPDLFDKYTLDTFSKGTGNLWQLAQGYGLIPKRK